MCCVGGGGDKAAGRPAAHGLPLLLPSRPPAAARPAACVQVHLFYVNHKWWVWKGGGWGKG